MSLDGTSDNCELPAYPVPYPSAVTYNHGSIIACGGLGEINAAKCWSYNGNVWSPLPNSVQRHCPDTVNIPVDGGWWVSGRPQFGSGGACAPIWSSEIFDGERWLDGPGLYNQQDDSKTSAEFGCIATLNSSHSLFVGGSQRTSAWLYDRNEDKWTETGQMKLGRRNLGCIGLGSKGVLVVGGDNQVSGHLYSVELYDPVTGTWSEQPDRLRTSRPLLLNWNGIPLALLKDQNNIYQRGDDGVWLELQGITLPEIFQGNDGDEAILVPEHFIAGCV